MGRSRMKPAAEVTSAAFATLAERLAALAQSEPERTAYVFLVDDEREERITLGELDGWARRIAGAIRAHAGPGARAVLMLRPGLPYVAAVLGCWYAGCSAVPAYPAGRRAAGRIGAIVANCRARLCLTTQDLLQRRTQLDAAIAASGGPAAPVWIAVDRAAVAGEDAVFAPDAAHPALIQYTSGTTRTPRGVVLSHANLLHNLQIIQTTMGHDRSSVGAGWLPPHHDMGLIGLVLQPLFVGFPCTLFSPIDFVQRPIRWLRAIARARATTSGGPSFAYGLCVDKIDPAELRGLDLSCWRVAFVGAEPIRADLLDAFAARYAPFGFDRRSFFACYGLAESTLMVTAAPRGHGVQELRADSAALQRGRIEPAPSGRSATRLVSCGTAAPGHRIAIVDPATEVSRSEAEIGEVWVSGPSVAAGYWESEAETRASFAAGLANEGGCFLRTRDLGALVDGNLFVTGRLDDLILLHGRNIHPHDIETTAQQSHPALVHAPSALFASQDGIVLVQEIDPKDAQEAAALIGAIRAAVAAQHELPLNAICLVRKATLPRTSSGKMQRMACRAAYESGELHLLACEERGPSSAQRTAQGSRGVRAFAAGRSAIDPS